MSQACNPTKLDSSRDLRSQDSTLLDYNIGDDLEVSLFKGTLSLILKYYEPDENKVSITSKEYPVPLTATKTFRLRSEGRGYFYQTVGILSPTGAAELVASHFFFYACGYEVCGLEPKKQELPMTHIKTITPEFILSGNGELYRYIFTDTDDNKIPWAFMKLERLPPIKEVKDKVIVSVKNYYVIQLYYAIVITSLAITEKVLEVSEQGYYQVVKTANNVYFFEENETSTDLLCYKRQKNWTLQVKSYRFHHRDRINT
ncbi:Hypothetical protein HVR_LOCUS210 [uncultured virus]|nr:Hypothetical protein HVR_LOCUS210 [uncultured virus]